MSRLMETFKPSRRFWSESDDAVVRAMVSAGAHDREICDRLGRSPSAVKNRIHRMFGGPTGRPRGAAATRRP